MDNIGDYSINGLKKTFKTQAEQYDQWYDDWLKKYPEAAKDQKKFNLPLALYKITSEISILQEACYGTQKPN